MTREGVVGWVVMLVIGIPALLLFTPASGQQDEIQAVRVTNFPALQKVAGSVSVEGPVAHATLRRLTDILVPPVDPKEVGRLIDAGVLPMDGFTSAVLSLNGQAKGRVVKSGTVGAILIPDEETVVRAFEEEGQAQFSQELTAPVVAGASRSFSSTPTRQLVAFPRYRVRLYNSSDKTVTVNLFAYLTN